MEASQVFSPPLLPVAPGGIQRPRIGIAGIAIESSTFSPHLTTIEDFTVRCGEELLSYYSFLKEGRDLREAAEWVPLVQARALPGGAVEEDSYDALERRILGAIKASHDDGGPFDGFYLDIHGAMSIVGRMDAEGGLAQRLRAALGPETLISCSMDLHGNVSRPLLESVDLITCYRMAPHEDEQNTKERAVFNLLKRLRAGTGSNSEERRPFKAWVQVPVLLPGEMTSTRQEPAASIYREVARIAEQPGITDASVWVGYAWADEPRCQAHVVVSGDDQAMAVDSAEALGRLYWEHRKDFSFAAGAGSLQEVLKAAMSPEAPRPYFISDSGDNPTAGGTGDVTWTLNELVRDHALVTGPLRIVHASVFDPAAVAKASEAGAGRPFDAWVGAGVDNLHSGPVRLQGEVHSVHAGDPVAGAQAVIRVGNIYSVLTERRKPFHKREDFTVLGIVPEEFDIVVVKIGYLEPELFETARGWMLALTPGGVNQDLKSLGHRRLAHGVYPFEDRAKDPDLRAFVHPSGLRTSSAGL